MKTTLISRLICGILAVAVPSCAVCAFSIDDVLVEPSQLAALGTPVTFSITMMVSGGPPSLYKQTEIVRAGTKILVRVFPASGPIQSIVTLRERVSLGVLPLGDYAFEVQIQLRTNSTGGWGRRSFTCNFSVVPMLSIVQSGTNVVLRWPSAATNYVLQTTSSFSSPAWAAASDTPGVAGEEHVLTIRPSGVSQYFRLWRDYDPGPCDPPISSGAP